MLDLQLTDFLFYAFALLITLSSIAVISLRNPIYSVLCLILAFFASAGIFLLIGAELISMLVVIVYVGAVAVLFLFVVMMLNIKLSSNKKSFQSYFPAGIIFAAFIFTLVAIIMSEYGDNATNSVSEFTDLPLAEASGEEPLTNSHEIGNVLYTDYILAFQTSGLILLLAMVGAIVLTLRHKEGVKRQSISSQVSRSIKDTITIVKSADFVTNIDDRRSNENKEQSS